MSIVESIPSSKGSNSRRQERDSDIQSTPSREREDKAVRFDQQVRVHQHQLILGDNPGVSDGIPLTLDWDADASFVQDLNKSDEHPELSKIPPQHRQVIAEAENPQCISHVQQEVEATKVSRRKSMNDPTQPLWKRLQPRVRLPRMFRKKTRYAT